MSDFVMRTASGKPFDEASSALQKMVRRGLVREAVYFAVDFYRAGFGEYVFRRLFIMAAEDIGLANPMLIVQLRALYESWQSEQKRKDGGEARLFFTMAVMLAALSPKSRDVDNVLIYFFGDAKNIKMDVPDCAVDRHTKRGRGMGRNWEHFWEEGSKLEPEAYPLGEEFTKLFRDRAKATLAKCRLPPDENKAIKGEKPGDTPTLF